MEKEGTRPFEDVDDWYTRSVSGVTAPWAEKSGTEIVAEITEAKEKIWAGRLEGVAAGSDSGEVTYTHSGPPVTLSSGDTVTYGTGTGVPGYTYTDPGFISSGSISSGSTSAGYWGAISPAVPASPRPKVVITDHNGNALDLGDMVVEVGLSYDRSVGGAMAATVTMRLREGVVVGKTPEVGGVPAYLTFKDETEFDAIRMSKDLFDPDDYDPEDGSEL